jgi:hypothetical protein
LALTQGICLWLAINTLPEYQARERSQPLYHNHADGITAVFLTIVEFFAEESCGSF